jgi:Fe-S-cluster-containing dehydrogenase component
MTTTQLGFSFDLSRCSGCMACMVACFDQNDMPGNGSTFRHVSRIQTGAYPSVNIRKAGRGKGKGASARVISPFNPNLVLTLAQAPQK